MYRVEYSYLNVNLLTGNATIRNFKLIPDTGVYNRMVLARKAPDNLYTLSVKKLILKSFHPAKLYRYRKLTIDAIVIDQPELIIVNKRQLYNDSLLTAAKTPYRMISKFISELSLKKVLLNDIDFAFINKSNRLVKTAAIKGLNIRVDDFLIDSLSINDKSRFYYTRNIEVTMNNYKIATPDSLYYLTLKDFNFSASGRKLILNNLKLEPRYNISRFYEKTGYAKERYVLAFDQITVNRIDLENFVKDQRLHAKSMDVTQANIAVFNNNSYPKKTFPRFGKFPHMQLRRMALDLKIDTLNLKNINISYAEHDSISGHTGKVLFSRTSGRFFNVTNDPASLKKNHYMRADLNSWLMNSGKLALRFNFDLTDEAGGFTYSGSLGPMNGRVLNNITRPIAMVEIKSAEIQKLTFKASANEQVTRGTMQLYYNDLSVQVLKRNEKSGSLRNQGIISGLANAFVIESDNPSADGKFIKGDIYFERPPEASFFSYLWQGLFTGIKESVGVSPEREIRIRGTVEKFENMFDRMKEKNAGRKEVRKKRRIERKKEKEEKENEKLQEERDKVNANN